MGLGRGVDLAEHAQALLRVRKARIRRQVDRSNELRQPEGSIGSRRAPLKMHWWAQHSKQREEEKWEQIKEDIECNNTMHPPGDPGHWEPDAWEEAQLHLMWKLQ